MIFSVIFGKMLVFIGKLMHRGSSLPGEKVLKINKKFFKKLKLPKTVIAVTGSSGKGSISSMLANIYRKMGYSVAHNSKGSNLSAGIATLMLEDCTLTGKIKKDVLIFEIDERYTKYVFKDIVPNYVVISNICRDQPPRQGHFDLVFEEIKKALTPDMHLILNGDDPYLQKFVNEDYKVTYYGMNQNKYSYDKNLFSSLNMYYCPKCGEKINYNYYHFENMGDYYCTNCSFKRPNIDYVVTDLNYDTSNIVVNDKYNIHIPFNALYAVYNTMAAFSCVGAIGLDLENVSNIISDIPSNTKLNNTYDYNGRLISVLSTKNENNTTFNEAILYTKRFDGKKIIVVGWKEISRRYTYDDLSWLYDVDFDILIDSDIEACVCVGINRYDIALRMKYAGFNEQIIYTYETLDEASNFIKNETTADVFAILNFDYVEPFNKMMSEGEKDEY